ncbi:MAG: O-succinylhomoserine sulfhydrylase [Geminicoccaceae bacterium]|nr:O-succinylhomoserine sulfhydrylase [Geminicoccaceae bacterium]
MSDGRGLQTTMIHGGIQRSQHGETAEAIFLTSGFIYEHAEQAEDRFKDRDHGFMYSRYGNPTVRTFEERMIALEGAEDACATSSGMAAVHAAIMCQARSGMRVVGARLLFGSCRYILTDILTRFGVEVELVDGTDLDAWERALDKPTDLVFFETPGNPTLELVDIEAVCTMAHAAGAKVIVDNVFATPMLQRPLELGADIVAYSATKHIDGQGRCLGGIVLGSQEFHDKLLHPYLKHTGPSLSPFNAWVLLKGLETLDLRVRQHVENAGKLARFLEDHPAIEQVIYPGLESFPQYELARRQMKGGSSLLGFYLGGPKERTFRFMNSLEIIEISNNLGDSKSLVTHPATTTHSKLSDGERAELRIRDDFLRLSVGLENVEDLMKDIDRALGA